MTEVKWPGVCPASGIASWGAWPDDVRDTLRRWNHQHWHGDWRLTFAIAAFWPSNRPRVFKCFRCRLFHETPTYGRAVFEGRDCCDECLIELARETTERTG